MKENTIYKSNLTGRQYKVVDNEVFRRYSDESRWSNSAIIKASDVSRMIAEGQLVEAEVEEVKSPEDAGDSVRNKQSKTTYFYCGASYDSSGEVRGRFSGVYETDSESVAYAFESVVKSLKKDGLRFSPTFERFEIVK